MTEAQGPSQVAASAPATESTPAFDPRSIKHKLKIDGQEIETDYDDLIAQAQLGKVSTKKFQDAATMKRQVDELIGNLSKKDINAFKRLAQTVGPAEFRELAESYLIEQIDYERLPEPEKKARTLEEENKALKKQVEDKEKAEAEQYRSQAKNVALQEIDKEISEALQSHTGKAKPRVVARIVERMLANFSSKEAKLPAAKAAELEFAELDMELKDWLSSKSAEELRSILPKNLLDGLRKADLELARGQFNTSKTNNPKQQNLSSKKPKRMSSEEAFRQMESRFG